MLDLYKLCPVSVKNRNERRKLYTITMKRNQGNSELHGDTDAKRQKMDLHDPKVLGVKPSVISKFRHRYSGEIFNIFPLENDLAIIHRLRSSVNEIVKKNGDVVAILRHNEKFNSFAKTAKGEYLASNLYHFDVKKIDLQGMTKEYLNTYPYRPCSLYTTSAGNTLLAAVQMENERKGIVLVLEEQGEMIRQTEIRKPEFDGGPMRITENINGDICVITTGEDVNPRVVKIFDRNWNFKAEYLSENAGFYPLGLCCDKYGHILIASPDSHEIVMLSEEGSFCQILTSEGDGILGPRCLARDENNCIWVGCKNGEVYILDY